MQERQQSASWRKQTLNAQILSKSQATEAYNPLTITMKPIRKSNAEKKSEGQFAASTTVAPLAPVNMNAPVPHTLAGPSMTASKENQFHFQVFKLRISPWIQPWWGLRNRPWWTRSPAVKCLPSLADRSELLSFQNCSPVLVNAELSLSRMIRVFCWLL